MLGTVGTRQRRKARDWVRWNGRPASFILPRPPALPPALRELGTAPPNSKSVEEMIISAPNSRRVVDVQFAEGDTPPGGGSIADVLLGAPERCRVQILRVGRGARRGLVPESGPSRIRERGEYRRI